MPSFFQRVFFFTLLHFILFLSLRDYAVITQAVSSLGFWIHRQMEGAFALPCGMKAFSFGLKMELDDDDGSVIER